MRDIYKQAAEVVVWLGEEDEASKTAISLSARHCAHERGQEADGEMSLSFGRLVSEERTRMTQLDLCLSDLGFLACGRFNTQVQVLCGRILLTWVYLAIALDMLRASDYRWDSAMRLQAYLSRLLSEKGEGKRECK